MAFWNRRKSIDSIGMHDGGEGGLKRSLGWPHLMLLGVGAIVGTGIYTLTGVGVAKAGPGIVVAFALVGVICAAVPSHPVCTSRGSRAIARPRRDSCG